MNQLFIPIAFVLSHKQAFFLGSLLALLVGNVFFATTAQTLGSIVLILQNMLFSTFLVHNSPKWLKRLFYLFIAIALARLVLVAMGNPAYAQRPGDFIFMAYFIVVSFVLFADLYFERRWNMESVYAIFSGFILLAFAFGFILMILNNNYPVSIKGIEAGASISDYVYFSFITLMTIGYGDITPYSELAKKIVVIAALVGHFYTVFITALIIGKLFQNNQSHANKK